MLLFKAVLDTSRSTWPTPASESDTASVDSLGAVRHVQFHLPCLADGNGRGPLRVGGSHNGGVVQAPTRAPLLAAVPPSWTSWKRLPRAQCEADGRVTQEKGGLEKTKGVGGPLGVWSRFVCVSR